MRLKRMAAFILAAVVLLQCAGVPASAATYVNDPLKFAVQSPQQPDNLPSSYMSSVSAPRGQGEDNVGWAFAAVAAAEAAGLAKGQITARDTFSENHMRYALSRDGGNPCGFDRRYTEAGSRRMVTAYLMRGRYSGLVPTASDPYSAGGSKAARALSETTSKEPEMRATGVIYLPDATDSTRDAALARIKGHIREYGAVAVSFYYDEKEYADGVYCHTGDDRADHAAVLVGWDDGYSYTYTDSDGSRKSGRGAFTAIDSEGASGRTYRLGYETPLTDAYAVQGISKELFDITHEHDVFGPSSTMGYRSDTAWMANVFTVSGKTEALSAVSFFAAGEGTTVEFYLAADASSVSDALRQAAQGSPLTLEGGKASATFDMPGYYSIRLDRPLPLAAQGEKFAIVARVTTAYGTEPIPLQAADTDAAAGQSFISGDGAYWIDAASNNSAVACLKAHCAADMEIPLTRVEVSAPAASDGALSGDVLRMSTGSALKLEAKSTPAGASNIISTAWSVRNPETSGEFISPGASPSDTDVIRYDAATGRITALREGTGYVRVTVQTGATAGLFSSSGGTFSHTLEVRVSDVEAVEISLDMVEAEITTAQTLRLRATVFPEDATDKELTWLVASDRWGTPFPLPASAAEPYSESRPPLTVTDGVATPLRPGECWIFARTKDGGAEASCHVRVTEIQATGMSLNRSALTVSTGTEHTLLAVYQPANASFRDTMWSSDNEAVASVGSGGIVYGHSAGTARIYATNRAGHTSVCEITVTEAPTLVIGLNKSASLLVQGFNSSDIDIVWEQTSSALLSAVPVPGSFETEQSGRNRLRVTARSVGTTTITAVIRKNSGTKDEPVYDVIGRQSWRIEGVVTLKHLQIKDANGAAIKKLTLCVDTSGRMPPETVDLSAAILLPEDATELGYVWSSRNDAIAAVEPLPGFDLNQGARITATGAGTTLITATNYNTGRRASVSVTVKPYPSGLELLSASNVEVRIGKRVSVRTRVHGAFGADKTLRYTVTNVPGNLRPHTEEDPIATVDAKGRVTAVRSGSVTVHARAKPYSGSALSVTTRITCYRPIKDLAVSAGAEQIRVRGGTNLTVSFEPEDVDDTSVTFIVEDSSVAEVKQYSFGYAVEGLKPGSTKITVVSADGRKKATLRIRVK